MQHTIFIENVNPLTLQFSLVFHVLTKFFYYFIINTRLAVFLSIESVFLQRRYSPLRTPFFSVGDTRCPWLKPWEFDGCTHLSATYSILFYCGWGARNGKGNVVEGMSK